MKISLQKLYSSLLHKNRWCRNFRAIQSFSSVQKNKLTSLRKFIENIRTSRDQLSKVCVKASANWKNFRRLRGFILSNRFRTNRRTINFMSPSVIMYYCWQATAEQSVAAKVCIKIHTHTHTNTTWNGWVCFYHSISVLVLINDLKHE